MKREELDRAIDDWAQNNHISMLKDSEISGRYFCYISGKDESFQIVVELPVEKFVTINCWDVETIDGIEFHSSWTGYIEDINIGLSQSLKTVQEWIDRL